MNSPLGVTCDADEKDMPVSLRASLGVFVERPRRTALLALLLVVLGVISISGLVPLSANRQYFPGHAWLLAGLCWAVAISLGYCAAIGLKSGIQKESKE